ncbi:MAG: segregation and condensation protein B [Chlamydiales bacterium]|jgi:segregation and condensation protein B
MPMMEINLLDDFSVKEDKKEDRGSAKKEDRGSELHQEIKGTVEALLFASREPLPLRSIRDITDNISPLKPRALKAIIDELKDDYEKSKRSFQIDEIGDGYLLRTVPRYGPYVEMLLNRRRQEKLSPAATEVLAIIAYRQPVTRSVIDGIRGVDSSGSLYALIERELVECVGRLEAPGRPALYSVTSRFMQHFGIRDLEELISKEKVKLNDDRDEESEAEETEAGPEVSLSSEVLDEKLIPVVRVGELAEVQPE